MSGVYSQSGSYPIEECPFTPVIYEYDITPSVNGITARKNSVPHDVYNMQIWNKPYSDKNIVIKHFLDNSIHLLLHDYLIFHQQDIAHGRKCVQYYSVRRAVIPFTDCDYDIEARMTVTQVTEMEITRHGIGNIGISALFMHRQYK